MVQIAEQDTVPETIAATLSYFVDTKAVPVTLVGEPGGRDVRTGGGSVEPRRVVYPEMEALLKAESGAERVVVFDHTLRTADDECREARKIREVVRRVHN